MLEQFGAWVALIPNVIFTSKTHGQRLGSDSVDIIFLCEFAPDMLIHRKPELPRETTRGHAINSDALNFCRYVALAASCSSVIFINGRFVVINPDKTRVIHPLLNGYVEHEDVFHVRFDADKAIAVIPADIFSGVAEMCFSNLATENAVEIRLVIDDYCFSHNFHSLVLIAMACQPKCTTLNWRAYTFRKLSTAILGLSSGSGKASQARSSQTDRKSVV